ncbi:hypothetical protein ACLOJK_035104 [Asimina triloba]
MVGVLEGVLEYADELKNAKAAGSFKKFIAGRSSEATFAEAFEKQEAIIRYLGGFDPTGENLQSSQKQSAAKHCNCSIADVENALSKFTWAKEAQKKMEKLKEEGKPIPKSLAEVQKNESVSSEDAGAQEGWIVISHIARVRRGVLVLREKGGKETIIKDRMHVVDLMLLLKVDYGNARKVDFIPEPMSSPELLPLNIIS